MGSEVKDAKSKASSETEWPLFNRYFMELKLMTDVQISTIRGVIIIQKHDKAYSGKETKINARTDFGTAYEEVVT